MSEQEITFIGTLSIPASAPANSTLIASLLTNAQYGSSGAVNVYQVPKGFSLIIEDIYVNSSPAVDAQLEIRKNDITVMARTDPLSTMLVSNPSRPKISPLVYEEGDRLSIAGVTLAAGGSSASTDTFYVKGKLVATSAGNRSLADTIRSRLSSIVS